MCTRSPLRALAVGAERLYGCAQQCRGAAAQLHRFSSEEPVLVAAVARSLRASAARAVEAAYLPTANGRRAAALPSPLGGRRAPRAQMHGGLAFGLRRGFASPPQRGGGDVA